MIPSVCYVLTFNRIQRGIRLDKRLLRNLKDKNTIKGVEWDIVYLGSHQFEMRRNKILSMLCPLDIYYLHSQHREKATLVSAEFDTMNKKLKLKFQYNGETFHNPSKLAKVMHFAITNKQCELNGYVVLKFRYKRPASSMLNNEKSVSYLPISSIFTRSFRSGRSLPFSPDSHELGEGLYYEIDDDILVEICK